MAGVAAVATWLVCGLPALASIATGGAEYILDAAAVWILVAIQTVVMSPLFVREAPFTELLSLAMAIGGFQVFASASSFLALHEAAARATLAGRSRPYARGVESARVGVI